MVGYTDGFGMSDHPVCGAKVGFAGNFFMPQPPLLTEEGNTPVPGIRVDNSPNKEQQWPI